MSITSIQLRTSTATLAGNTVTLIKPQNASRRYLLLQNTGTASVTFGTTTGVAVGLGFISLDPATAAGGQGGSAEFTSVIPQNPIYAISATGTTVTVSED